jgi:dTDP-4-amino-4,6-dideoxygalactose transaminase
MNKPIFVTQPMLPPLEAFVPLLTEIWDSKVLTNGGPYHQQLEAALCDYLGVKHLSLFTNGTIALVTALQALRITGEVVTTPFSFVATAHSLLWNGIKPVFVDIHPDTFNLDPDRIESAITAQTTAILPVHVYGRPCDVEAIEQIASLYNLQVIYDAAHAFGVRCHCGSVLNHGDLSVLSFHATKVYNTFEGGAIVCHDEKMKRRIDYLKNFGFADEVTVVAPGINGKMSEFNAALGLLQLEQLSAALQRRAQIDEKYRDALQDVPGIRIPTPVVARNYNHAYFPVLVTSEHRRGRDGLFMYLREHKIFSRRYFYPLISDFPMYRGLPSAAPSNLPVAHSVARQILCLPIYPGLTDDDLNRIIDLIRSA